jgi:secretion/DNA translocation related TadE-like protein
VTGGPIQEGGGAGHDIGSATVWSLALALAVLTLVWAATLVALAVGARHRAEAAADLAALAGAAAARDGRDGCAAAAQIATANDAQLEACQWAADGSLVVGVAVRVPPALSRWTSGPVTVQARAGS